MYSHRQYCVVSQSTLRWIEFIGPSGSGKSTLAQTLSNKYVTSNIHLYAQNASFADKLKKVPYINRLLNNLFEFVAPQFRDQLLTKYPDILTATHSILTLYDDGKSMYQHAMNEWAKLGFAIDRLDSDEIYVGDDGPYSFYTRLLAFEGWDAQKLLEHLPHPDKFVFVHASPQTCLNRQEHRLRGRANRIKGLPTEHALKFLEESHNRGNQVIAAAEQAGIETQTISTENTRPHSISL